MVNVALADAPTLDLALELVQLQLSVDIAEPAPRLARLEQAALVRAREAIDAEIGRLVQLLRPLPV